MVSPMTIEPAPNRRKTERIPLVARIRLNVMTEGLLTDLSEGGALLRLRRSQEPDRQVTLTIEEGDGALHLPARIVRSTPVSLHQESATPARTEFQVAVEFLQSSRHSGSAVRGMVQKYRSNG